MINESALKGQTDKLYFRTSLAPPNVIPSGSLALLLLQAQQLHERTWIYQHPTSRVTRVATPRLATSCCCRSSRLTREGGGDNKQAPRAFAFGIASKIGAEFCQHNSAPEPLADMSAELKKQDAVRHPGLCGHPHAWVIAEVKTQDVETKWGLYYCQQVSQPRKIIFLLVLHVCYMNARSYSCSL